MTHSSSYRPVNFMLSTGSMGDSERWPIPALTALLPTPAWPKTSSSEAFLGVWRNAGRYVAGRGSVKTWILAVVHHRAVDAVRRRRTTTELPEREDLVPRGLTVPDVWPVIAGHSMPTRGTSARDRVSPVRRQAIELAYFAGLTQVEIDRADGHPARNREGPDAARAPVAAARPRRRRRRAVPRRDEPG